MQFSCFGILKLCLICEINRMILSYDDYESVDVFISDKWLKDEC